jgi:hypothetical protein
MTEKRGGENAFTGVRVFSATRARDREELGGVITEWIATHPELEIVSCDVRQSSDREFHCLTITFFYREVSKA